MIDLSQIESLRLKTKMIKDAYGGYGDSGNGVFIVTSPVDGHSIGIIASNGGGWDHVSVSRSDRCPDWNEMDFVKRLFFGNEVAMQLHVHADNHVNNHDFCLHLWRPNDGQQIPLPPVGFV